MIHKLRGMITARRAILVTAAIPIVAIVGSAWPTTDFEPAQPDLISPPIHPTIHGTLAVP